jgi:hypothetical protein
MGYTTKFDEILTLDKPLFDHQFFYLLESVSTQWKERNAALLEKVLDPARAAIGCHWDDFSRGLETRIN